MQQPVQPPVPMTDEALKLIWQQEGAELAKARERAALAEPLERDCAERRENGRQLREKAQNLIDQAAAAEAQANDDERQARLLRQDEKFHLDNATKISTAVNYLGAMNDLTHPHLRQQRVEQAAAANGQQHPAFTAPIEDLVANGASETRPLPTEALK